jgi:hypothetical protein
MSAQSLNLNSIEQGATWSQQITLDPVVDLTGYTGVCRIRQYTNQNYPILAEPTVTIDTPASGILTLSLTATQSANLPCTGLSFTDRLTLYYDVEVTSGTTVLRILQGTVQVTPRV